MDLKFIQEEMDRFLFKYTRFLSKNIYISRKMDQKFIEQYQYLFQELDQVTFLYRDHYNYRKVMNIRKNHVKFVQLHNQKYLKKKLEEYEPFFNSLYSTDLLSQEKRKIILSQEENLFLVQRRGVIPFIVSKVKFLMDQLKINPKKILILVDSNEMFLSLQKEFHSKKIEQIHLIKYFSKQNHFKTNQKSISQKERIQQMKIYFRENAYQYFIFYGNIPIEMEKNCLRIVSQYPKINLLNEDIKFLYDYQKYLQENKILNLKHTYLGKDELDSLTKNYLRKHKKKILEQLKQKSINY